MTTEFELRYASHPLDAKDYDTGRLRTELHIADLFKPGKVKMVYSMYDRMIVGGVYPADKGLLLETIDPLKADYFLERREIGIFNVGGTNGKVIVDGEVFELAHKESLYIGRGKQKIVFESVNVEKPAKFYFCSTNAHTAYPTKKVTRQEADVMELGALESSNHRVINKMLVNQVLPTCQLQMGMTELKPGSVWNTMPAHIHSRRMEAYFYFDLPQDQAVCHFMGEPNETRHIWMRSEEAVLSPEWSIHSGAGTWNYTFIWAMGGENLDYGDQDFSKITDLK